MGEQKQDKSAFSGDGRTPSQSSSNFNVEEYKNLITLDAHRAHNVNCYEGGSSFTALGYDNTFSLEKFQKNCRIEITKVEEDAVEFDLLGVDPPLANAIRRILLAEVPTVAIESVCVYQNTAVLHDEYLSHRLGLVPLAVDAEDMDWVREGEEKGDGCARPEKVRFMLHAHCKGEDLTVYSGDLVWQPETDREREYFADNPPRPIHDDIILARLAKNQEILLECWAQKGQGKDHAKWSPVGTAWYRLMPKITLLEPIYDEEAEKLEKCCASGTFGIIEENGRKRAIVKDVRSCTTDRECIDPERGLPGKVLLQKVKDHFLWRIESIGQIPPMELFERALQELSKKCGTAANMLKEEEYYG
ncbi:unnamed protein product [Amoebophrya sp. A25]|nr:unnamed protein product [Amoebophrya sp. A25]|eukprot:GSA25T00010134001.1